MQTHTNIYNKIYAYENLLKAYKEARKSKTQLTYVIAFTKELKENLLQLQKELKEETYQPHPLTTFTLRDPKLRIISKSIFKDRIIHHALVQVIEPLFDPTFIFDSHANRIGKGTAKALERYDLFLRKLTQNGKNLYERGDTKFPKGYALKADIKKYFDNVDQKILLEMIKRKIKDEEIIWLIRKILQNFTTEIQGKGMPLGNLTSQFFANIYLNELDQFIKHILKIRYYIRYVDDFVILNESKETLETYKEEINQFLKQTLKIELHPEKSKIISLSRGVQLLGFRVFHTHKILRKKARRRIIIRLNEWKELYDFGLLEPEQALEKILGWMAYAVQGNTYHLRKKLMKIFYKRFKLKNAKL